MVTQGALDEIVSIAAKADEAILRHYGEPIDVERKADRSPVTAADRAAHQVILEALEHTFPDVPVVSEEGTIPSYELRRHWSRFWLVDPLDGTKEFIKRNGEFTVNIALIEDGAPVLAVVSAPASGLRYFAGRGLGSWRQAPGHEPEQLSSHAPVAGTPLVVVESRSHPSPELEAFLGTIEVSRRVQAGSSLKFCLVADGTADLYPRFGPTMEWDSAAGDCIFRYSGRSGERHSPLRYNTPDLRNPPFIIGLEAA